MSSPPEPSDQPPASQLKVIDRQREHQANERTFLAWLRTALSLIGFGFAIARFSLFLRQFQANLSQDPQQAAPIHPLFNSENLGLMLVLFGVLLIGLSAWRYEQVLKQIEESNYQPNRLLVWFMAAMVTLFGLLSIPLVLWRGQTQIQSPTDLPD
ncbi:MAG: YidH family protein [Cyanophyceae cyanobacterium]|jgi:putative membrane protein